METDPPGRAARSEAARRGWARMIVEDTLVEVDAAEQVSALDHNSIDRFTGGVRNRLLYSEEAVLGGAFAVNILVLPPLEESSWPDGVRKAFCAALRDLCEGRLALGAKSLGFCTGGAPVFEGEDEEKGRWQAAWDASAPAALPPEQQASAA